jgi:salicylate hydroxylase
MWGVSRDPVIVVGAGIGGLTCALALLQRGIEVEVYEQAPELREIGAGVQISANGTRVLNALGLEQGLDAWAVRPQSKEIRHWKSGRTWKLSAAGAPGWLLASLRARVSTPGSVTSRTSG